jgi:hypothetical protein
MAGLYLLRESFDGRGEQQIAEKFCAHFATAEAISLGDENNSFPFNGPILEPDLQPISPQPLAVAVHKISPITTPPSSPEATQ